MVLSDRHHLNLGISFGLPSTVIGGLPGIVKPDVRELFPGLSIELLIVDTVFSLYAVQGDGMSLLSRFPTFIVKTGDHC